ncbi:CIC11C00000005260 [Sungouiella intermedia]|uniref:CIC11C00000005260 n=1 Tax=Sungouiella intermedia TaxID=45354 RepID=A0A1L0B8J2_9ASCO|nr:CIC11C00000005260 [[Candida] intermedia]
MPVHPEIISKELKRDLYYGNDWGGGARWAFFAIFIVLIIIVIIGTLRINRARSRQGIQPLYGTRWMTPPSYLQSQDQYNQPTRRDPDMPNAYVPTYSERANDNDMGYYDNSGTFHPNPNAKGPLMPEPAHQRSSSNTDGIPLTDYNQTGSSVPGTVSDEYDDMFRRPLGPPPRSTTTETIYERPTNPPPTQHQT